MEDSIFELKEYISVYHEVLPQNFCDALIQKFEKNEEHEQEQTIYVNRHFMEVNITKWAHWKDQHDIMAGVVRDLVKRYQDEHKIIRESQWPKSFGYEQFRMKRYLPNGRDEFSFHTDVGSYTSARRFLSFLFYLNTVEEGGKTQFAYAPGGTPFFTITPQRGKVLLFPPLWTYPHWGEKPISGPKYVISSYLHYL